MPVTSGSEAGHSTDGNGISAPPLAVGCFVPFALPPSPEDPSTVTPFAAALMYAKRRFWIDVNVLNASSADAKLCEMTCARP